MLTQYHNEFTRSVPDAVPAAARQIFENPLMLVQMRPQLEQLFGSAPGGLQLLQTLLLNVKTALTHGLQEIFFWSAVIMCASVVLHVFLKGVPLRVRAASEASAGADAASAAAALH